MITIMIYVAFPLYDMCKIETNVVIETVYQLTHSTFYYLMIIRKHKVCKIQKLIEEGCALHVTG